MESELNTLEEKIGQFVRLCQQLRTENIQLRQQLAVVLDVVGDQQVSALALLALLSAFVEALGIGAVFPLLGGIWYWSPRNPCSAARISSSVKGGTGSPIRPLAFVPQA